MKKRLPQIETIRVLAMAGIFLYHIWSVLPEAGSAPPLGPLFGDILSQGYLGVIVFNIISGFVLTLPHAAPDGAPPMGPLEFYRRRFGRVCPQYYLSLSLWTAVALVLGAMPLAALALCVAEHAVFVHVLDPSRFFCLVPALWWMGLLAQFYLVFPFLARFFFALGPFRATAFFCFFCWTAWRVGVVISGWEPKSAMALLTYLFYFNLPWRLPEFVIGMYLATAWKIRQSDPAYAGQPRILLTALFGLAVMFTALSIGVKDSLPDPFGHILLTFTCLAVGATLFAWPAAARLGEKPVMAALAAASYSFYLVHQPLVGYVAQAAHGAMGPLAAFLLVLVVVGPAAYALALIMDRLTNRLLKPKA